MRIEADRIGWVRRNAAHWIGLSTVCVAIANMLLAPLLGRLALPVATIAWIGPAGAVLAGLLANAIPTERGNLALSDEGLVLARGDRGTVIALDAIEGALIRYRGHDLWLEIALANGDVLTARTEPHLAYGFLEELARRGLQRRLIVRGAQPWLTFVPPAARAGWIFLLVTLGLAIFFLRFLATAPVFRVLDVAIGTVVTYWLAHLGASPGIVLAQDGMTIAHPFSAEFVSWSRYDGLEVEGDRLYVRTRDGARVHLGPKRTQSQLSAVIDTMLGQTGERRDESVNALDRAGRSIEEWRAALSTLADDAQAYRGLSLGREALERVLYDATAPAERRIGAALALGDRERIRVAAQNTANEHLRIALEKASDGELEDAAVEDAIAAESPPSG